MKRTLLFTGLLLSLLLEAQAATKTFIFNGEEGTKTLDLQSVVTETRTRTEQVPSTCYRDEFAGYQTICSSTTVPVCSNTQRVCSEHCTPARPGQPNGVCHTVCRGGERVCHNEVRRECHQQAQYRTVAYSCIETRTIPYQVTLYKTEAAVNMHFGDLPAGISANEKISVTLDGQHLSVSVESSKKVLMLFERKQDAVMTGDTKKIKVDFFVELIDFTKIAANLAAGINDIKIDNDILTYSIGKTDAQISYSQSVKLEKIRVLARDRVLLDKKLSEDELTLTEQADKTLVAIDLAALNAAPEKGKHRVMVKSELNIDKAKILNRDLGELSVEKEVKLKLKNDDSED